MNGWIEERLCIRTNEATNSWMNNSVDSLVLIEQINVTIK